MVSWRLPSWVGFDLGDRDQRQTDVADSSQQAVQSGLVDDGAGDEGSAVALLDEGESFELDSPSGVEVSSKTDLVPVGGCLAHGAKLVTDVVSTPRHMW